MTARIDAARDADLDSIAAIAAAALPERWSREQLAHELALTCARVDVWRDGEDVLGFGVYWLVAGELQILAIATRASARRRGIAGALVDKALAAARAAGCTLATLEVRRGNTPAIALYERAGFRTVATRASYYRDGEDALVMQRALDG
jgi:ribosomal-protein-alanine N-acetyltransferase